MRPFVTAVLITLVALPLTATAGGLRRGAEAPPPAPAPASVTAAATVVGRVVTAAGEAIAGITVLAADARTGAQPRHRVRSDRAGQFTFSLPPGEYVFLALDRELAGATTPMTVARALEVVLVVSAAGLNT